MLLYIFLFFNGIALLIWFVYVFKVLFIKRVPEVPDTHYNNAYDEFELIHTPANPILIDEIIIDEGLTDDINTDEVDVSNVPDSGSVDLDIEISICSNDIIDTGE